MIFLSIQTLGLAIVNLFQWLKYTLENIMSINHKNLKDLYPQNRN